MTDKDYIKYELMCEELLKASELLNDELGDWWEILARSWPIVTSSGSKNLQKEFAKQIEEEHDNLLNNFEIVEKHETVAYKVLREK